jgi:hypothetical protein
VIRYKSKVGGVVAEIFTMIILRGGDPTRERNLELDRTRGLRAEGGSSSSSEKCQETDDVVTRSFFECKFKLTASRATQ